MEGKFTSKHSTVHTTQVFTIVFTLLFARCLLVSQFTIVVNVINQNLLCNLLQQGLAIHV